MSKKTVNEIVTEVIDTLNIGLPKTDNKKDAESVIKRAINKAFTYSNDPIENQKKLRSALQLRLAQDKLKSIDEIYAQFLVSKDWSEIAQAELNTAKETSEDKSNNENPNSEPKRPMSFNESLTDFIANTWTKAGISPKFPRISYYVCSIGLGVMADIAVISSIGFFPGLGYLFSTTIHNKLLSEEAELLSEELRAFEKEAPEAFSTFKAIAHENIRNSVYKSNKILTQYNLLNATPEEHDKGLSEIYKLFYVTLKNDKDFEHWFENTLRLEKSNFKASEILDAELKRTVLLSGANSATFAVKALFKSITSPLTGGPFKIMTSLLYRAFQLAMLVIIFPTLLSLKIARSFVFEPLQYLLSSLVNTAANLAILIITTPLILKQGLQYLWLKLFTAAAEPTAEPASANNNMSFFGKKYLAWNNINANPIKVMSATNDVNSPPKSTEIRGFFDDLDLDDASPESQEESDPFDKLDVTLFSSM